MTGWLEQPSSGCSRDLQRELSIPDHAHVFFCGDLNYRIDESLSHGTDKVIQILSQCVDTHNLPPPNTTQEALRGVTPVPALASLAR